MAVPSWATAQPCPERQVEIKSSQEGTRLKCRTPKRRRHRPAPPSFWRSKSSPGSLLTVPDFNLTFGARLGSGWPRMALPCQGFQDKSGGIRLKLRTPKRRRRRPAPPSFWRSKFQPDSLLTVPDFNLTFGARLGGGPGWHCRVKFPYVLAHTGLPGSPSPPSKYGFKPWTGCKT